MQPDNNTLKKVGELNGEPVYEMPTPILPAIESRKVPVQSQELEHFDALHRTFCLFCLFDSLITPLAELEEFVENGFAELQEIKNLPAEGEAALEFAARQEYLIRHLSVASAAVGTLQALIEVAARNL